MSIPTSSETEVERAVEIGRRVLRFADAIGLDADDLVPVLQAATMAPPAGADDPVRQVSDDEVAALRRSGALRAQLPAAGERASTLTTARTAVRSAAALTVGEVAKLLGRSEIRVRQRLAEHTLLGTREGRSWRVFAFQFDNGAELPGWHKIMSALPADVHPLSVERFLDTDHPDLEIDGVATSPRRWLSTGGDLEAVLALVADLHRIP